MAIKAKKHEIDLGIGSAITEIGDCDDSIPGIDPFEVKPIGAASAELVPTMLGDELQRSPEEQSYINATSQEQRNAEMRVDSLLSAPMSAIQLANELGYKGDLSPGALEDGIRSAMRRTIEECLDIGKRLLLLKAVTAHGQFTQRVELLGFHPRMARKFMTATQKFAKTDLKSVLKIGTQTKLLELLVLDDEELEGLGNGESVGDLNLDDIECMSVSELKAALRTHKREGSVEAKKAEERANRLQYQLDEKEDLIEALRNAQNLNPEFRLETNIIREQSALLDQQCAVALAALGDMADALDNEDGSEPEWDIRFQSVWFAAHAAYARALLLVQSLRSMDVDDLMIPADPGEFKEGLFTAQEAKAFIDEVDSNRIVLAEKLKLKRDKLEEDAPRGPGRPKKAKKPKIGARHVSKNL